MPKDERKIVSAVRMPATENSPRRIFRAGDEDELAKLDKETLTRLEESGAISGFASVTKDEAGAVKGGAKGSTSK